MDFDSQQHQHRCVHTRMKWPMDSFKMMSYDDVDDENAKKKKNGQRDKMDATNFEICHTNKMYVAAVSLSLCVLHGPAIMCM